MDASRALSAEGGDTGLVVLGDDGQVRPAQADEVLHRARQLLLQQLKPGGVVHSTSPLREHLQLQLGGLGHEVFVVVFLGAQHRLIALKEMFRGTVSKAAVYPREVAKEALALGAEAVILAHNHPSGSAEPSRADHRLTEAMQATLGLIDVRVTDHLIVADAEVVSFAERGLL